MADTMYCLGMGPNIGVLPCVLEIQGSLGILIAPTVSFTGSLGALTEANREPSDVLVVLKPETSIRIHSRSQLRESLP